VAAVGFEWEEPQQVWEKLREEWRELQDVLPLGDAGKVEDELGDMLFSLVNLARFLGADPERALERTVEKFTARFEDVERALLDRGRTLDDATLAEMDALWEDAKRRGVGESGASGPS
jgi:XTP/dITP diphosphohydrolase